MDKVNKSQFNQTKIIISRGVQAGALMALYLFVIQLASPDNATALSFGKYLFLGVILYMAIQKACAFFPRVSYFKEGMVLGAGISVVSAVVLILLNTLAFLLNADVSLAKFGEESTTFGMTLAINGILLFELFVGGMILTFIILQFSKKEHPDNEPLAE